MDTSTKQVLASDLLLTGSSAAASNVAHVNGLDQHSLYITYSPDTNSTNALEVTIETSPDGGTTWHPFTGAYSDSTGTITEGTQVTLSFASAGTTDQAQSPYFFNVASDQIRIKASETNTPGDYGNYTATLFSRAS